MGLVTLIERPEGIVVVLSAALCEPIVTRWRAHVLSAKVQLEPAWARVTALAAPAAARCIGLLPSQPGECRHGEGVSLLRWWGQGERFLLLAPASAPAAASEPSGMHAIEWHRADVAPASSHPPRAAVVLRAADVESRSAGGCQSQQGLLRRARGGRARRTRGRLSSTAAPKGCVSSTAARRAGAQRWGRGGEVVDAVEAESGCDLLAVLQLKSGDLALALEGGEGGRLEPAPLPYSVPTERAVAPKARL